MLTLDFKVFSRQDSIDLASMTSAELHYSLFQGSIIFKVGELDATAMWDWIPLLDFAYAHLGVLRSLRTEGAKETFEYTENDEKIFYDRRQEDVHIQCSYSKGKGVVRFGQLENAMHEFAARVSAAAISANPALSGHALFEALRTGHLN